jgi:hypothetical protein
MDQVMKQDERMQYFTYRLESKLASALARASSIL